MSRRNVRACEWSAENTAKAGGAQKRACGLEKGHPADDMFCVVCLSAGERIGTAGQIVGR